MLSVIVLLTQTSVILSCVATWVIARAGLQPVLVHMSKNKSGKYSFNPVSVNLMVELAKTLFALITLLIFVSTMSCCCASRNGGF